LFFRLGQLPSTWNCDDAVLTQYGLSQEDLDLTKATEQEWMLCRRIRLSGRIDVVHMKGGRQQAMRGSTLCYLLDPTQLAQSLPQMTVDDVIRVVFTGFPSADAKKRTMKEFHVRRKKLLGKSLELRTIFLLCSALICIICTLLCIVFVYMQPYCCFSLLITRRTAMWR
jgi:hypothetical protein